MLSGFELYPRWVPLTIIHSLSCFRMCRRPYKQDKSFSFGGNNIEVQKDKTTEC